MVAVTAAPLLARTREELHAALQGGGDHDRRVGLVPTMGALHAGHAALLERGRREIGPHSPLVVSIFVNPMQFGPGEDLERYPRSLEADLGICQAGGADIVFAPFAEEVYPDGEPQVSIEPGALGGVLEGATRPTHFRGVLTVVAKLFGLVAPDVAVFGQKDYQQLVLIRRMAADLCMGVDVLGAETVRHEDGLALSSRNRYLEGDQRAAATALSGALFAGRAAAGAGAPAVLRAAGAELGPDVQVDYLELTDPELGPAPTQGAARLLVAARVGSTRLIDNVALSLGSASEPRSAPPGGH